jgi:23S rRNA (uracil1939-C5)-methyltransferase
MTRPGPAHCHEESASAEGGPLDLRNVDASEELAIKRHKVQLALEARGITAEIPLPCGSPCRHGARARVDLLLDAAGRFLVHRQGTHEAEPAPLEDMARPEIAAVGRRVEACLANMGGTGLRVGRLALRGDGTRVVVVVEPAHLSGSAEALRAALGPTLGPRDALCLGPHALQGDPTLHLEVAGLSLHVGPQSFFQVNLEVNAALVAAVVEVVAAWRPARVLDLFAGAGNLSFPIAAHGVPVEAVESAAPSASDARANARRLGLPVQVKREDAYRLEAGSRFFDVAVLDPPRKGAGAALVAVCTTRPRGIVLVSCHPLSFARDLQHALARGYRIAGVRLFDMFPLTSHVESVAFLER